MNKQILQGKWRRLRGGVKMEWGRLTDNDRRLLDGKIDQMVGLFQERYGYTQQRATQAVHHYLGRYAGQPSPAAEFTRTQRPLLAWAALLGLGAVAWFFFKPFLTERMESITAELTDEETVTSPEMPY